MKIKVIDVIVEESSNISSFRYDRPTKVLIVSFVGGAKYRYSEVPIEVIFAWFAADSAGEYFYSQIRGKFEYEKL